ncbi:MAG: AraC family transcriptional regulator [Proteobacteria bacterium]|nr:AraC family transcriptional regulator [Pseudomonadota bacterium]
MVSKASVTRALRSIDTAVLESLFDSTPDTVFFVKNRDLQYVAVSSTLVERSGFECKSHLIGRTAKEVFGDSLGASFQEQDQRVVEDSEEIRDRLELHLYRGRTPGWCLTYKMPVRDSSGATVGLVGISRDLQQPEISDSVCSRLVMALERIQQGYAEPLRVDELARDVGLSRARFERHLRRIFGLTPGQLLAKTRLDVASSMLRDSEQVTISEVAHACGYSDHSAFSRHFKSVVGLTPTEFRQAVRRG